MASLLIFQVVLVIPEGIWGYIESHPFFPWLGEIVFDMMSDAETRVKEALCEQNLNKGKRACAKKKAKSS